MLAPKGAELVIEREGLRLPIKADRELAQLKHALLVTDFMIAMQEACAQSEFLRLVTPHEIISGAPPATRRDPRPTRWPVDIEYRGTRRPLHLECATMSFVSTAPAMNGSSVGQVAAGAKA
jgi:hypothetical protein